MSDRHQLEVCRMSDFFIFEVARKSDRHQSAIRLSEPAYFDLEVSRNQLHRLTSKLKSVGYPTDFHIEDLGYPNSSNLTQGPICFTRIWLLSWILSWILSCEWILWWFLNLPALENVLENSLQRYVLSPEWVLSVSVSYQLQKVG